MWKTIDSVPDDLQVLLYDYRSDFMWIGVFENGKQVWADLTDEVDPTHWRELPAPPTRLP